MTLAAVILDNRSIPLVNAIDRHMKMLPEKTALVVYTAEDHYHQIDDLFAPNAFHPLPTSFGIKEYNKILLDPNFWAGLCKYDRVLIFQHDSGILRKGIEEFYEWDYCGAPWAWNPKHIGNGGLSIRNPIVIREVCSHPQLIREINEDHAITKLMYQHKIGNLAPKEVAEKFSCEAIYKLGSWGYHAIGTWLTAEQCDKIKTQYL